MRPRSDTFNPLVRAQRSLHAGGYVWLQASGRELPGREIGLTEDQWHIIMVETRRRTLAGC